MNTKEKHRGHPKEIVVTKDPRIANLAGERTHYGKVVCRLCGGAFVRWVSREEAFAHEEAL